MFTCNFCDKTFKYESEKKRHEKSHIPQFECAECNKKFSFMSALKRHQKQHQRSGSVKCSDCGKRFLDETLLQRHKKYAHKETHVCVKCNAKFNSQQALQTHHKTHKPKSERRYHCSNKDCTKTFNFIHHLRHHELTHSTEKQHYCNLCGKGFIQLHHLKTHIKNHQPLSWFKCIVSGCKKFFTTEYALKRHLATHKNVENDYNLTHEEVPGDDWFDEYQVEDDIAIKDKLQTIPKLHSDSTYKIDLNDSVEKSNFDGKKKNVENSCYDCTCKGNVIKQSANIKKMPELKYNSDGTIKIMELVDNDIKLTTSTKETNKETIKNEISNNLILYNSCKAVLGSCIVSGNGTINEECLCAKMSMDDNQMISQEIDEITPHPFQV